MSISQLTERRIEWVVPEVLPKGMLTGLTGEEGIGKGLYCSYLIARLTAGFRPVNVLLISSEDDPQSMLIPRLSAAGADLDRVLLVHRGDISAGHLPVLPEDVDELGTLIRTEKIGAVIVDPWMSLVSPRLQVKDTQQARRALDPLGVLARSTECAVLLVGHTNRGDSPTARNRYGGTVGIRQVVRHSLMAVADPEDPDLLIIGTEKSNVSAITPAVRYRKYDREGAWRVEPDAVQTSQTIRQLVEIHSREQQVDRRFSPVRQQAASLLSSSGQVTRQQVIGLFKDAGSGEAAADKALQRWSGGAEKFLSPLGGGRYGPAEADLYRPPASEHMGGVR